MWDSEYGFERRAAGYTERVWMALQAILKANSAEGDPSTGSGETQALEEAIAKAAPELQPHVASGYDTILRMRVKDDVRKKLKKHEADQRKQMAGARAHAKRIEKTLPPEEAE
ncbi:hypothetical protein EPO34_00925 [Patescibacteria group bacterium]|nr:MAG: hypothetical protein EPO34_00925 [Patescibacteria group bacterium]